MEIVLEAAVEPMTVSDGVKPDENERACRSRAAARALIDCRFVMLDSRCMYSSMIFYITCSLMVVVWMVDGGWYVTVAWIGALTSLHQEY